MPAPAPSAPASFQQTSRADSPIIFAPATNAASPRLRSTPNPAPPLPPIAAHDKTKPTAHDTSPEFAPPHATTTPLPRALPPALSAMAPAPPAPRLNLEEPI